MGKDGKNLQTATLTIAGSDSCGGAGIQADLKTFKQFGVYGACVITAVTAQNTLEVAATESISPAMIARQFEMVLDDIPVRSIRTGMLPDAAAIETVCEIIERRCQGIPLVVDPVLVATSGGALTVEDTIEALKSRLIPLATLLTPNLVEARALTATEAETPPEALAQALLKMGCQAVLLKGGHGSGDTVSDLLLSEAGMKTWEHPNTPGDYHGTGCVLSSAIAAELAMGLPLDEAVSSAISYVQDRIANARKPLKGKLHLLT